MKQLLLGFFLLLAALALLYSVKFYPEIYRGDFSSLQPQKLPQFFSKKNPTITIQGKTFKLLLAKTPEETTKGLSGRESLPENTGMLFIFDSPAITEFWMKDMNFPIDIIFIRDNHITDIFANVPNPTEENPVIQRVKPSQLVNYVLEINPGLSDQYNFKVGDEVQLSL